MGTIDASSEAMRITRLVEANFCSGPHVSGSGFVVRRGVVLTCAHVVTTEDGTNATGVSVSVTGRPALAARISNVDREHDLAWLETDDPAEPPTISVGLLHVGQQMIFAGRPQGVKRISVFPGMVSAVGTDLVNRPRCQLIQIAGMINNGNSGGPLVDVDSRAVVGIVTAKYVPLLMQIDKLTRALGEIPQFPSSVALGGIDFARFVNLTINSMWQIAAVLRLVQVGTGWAVPARYFANARG